MAIFDNGCKDRMCIAAKRVYDACVQQITNADTTINLYSVTPENPPTPLNFVSGRSLGLASQVTDLTVTILSTTPRTGRVQGNVTIPMQINYTDALGANGVGTGEAVIPIDLVMSIPQPSAIPYQVEAVAAGVLTSGQFVTTTTEQGETVYVFNCHLCATLIIKIVLYVDVVIPYYSYAVIPPCTPYNEDVCSGFFELPLFPQSTN